MKKYIITLLIFSTIYGNAQQDSLPNMPSAKNRFYHSVSTGVLAGEVFSGSFQVVNGYAFNKHLGLGVGMGTERYFWDFSYALFLEGRCQFGKGKTQFFSAINLGISEPMERGFINQGGVTGTISFGTQRFCIKNVAITSSIGYRYGVFQLRDLWWENNMTTAYINQLELRFGICLQ